MTVHLAQTVPSAGSDVLLGEIAGALGAGFHELDALGRLPSATASHLLGRIRAQRDLALLSPAYLNQAFLGRFEELSADAQAGNPRRAISHRDLVHLSGQEFGPSFLRFLRTLWRVKLWMNARARRGGRLAGAGSTVADVVCYASRRLPGHASTTARRVSSRLAGWSSRGRSLATVLACTGLDEFDLVVDFGAGRGAAAAVPGLLARCIAQRDRRQARGHRLHPAASKAAGWSRPTSTLHWFSSGRNSIVASPWPKV